MHCDQIKRDGKSPIFATGMINGMLPGYLGQN